jgi:hypothetical protein
LPPLLADLAHNFYLSQTLWRSRIRLDQPSW